MLRNEGAVKGYADASPADSDDEARGDSPADRPTVSVGPENGGDNYPEAQDGREAFIPRDRFDQVNGRAQQLDRELQWHRDHSALVQRALTAGYRDLDDFQRDDNWARSQGFHGIDEYRAAAGRDRGGSPSAGRGDLNESVRADLMHDKLDRLRSRQEIQQVRGLLQSVQRATVDHALTSARQQFDHVDPEHWAKIELLCRDIGHPEGVHRVLTTFGPVMEAARKSAAEQAVIDHTSRRASAGQGAPPPEGRGVGQAPASMPKLDPRKAKNMLLSDLLGFRK